MGHKGVILPILLLIILMIMPIIDANWKDVRKDVRNQHNLINVTAGFSNHPNPKFGQSLWARLGSSVGMVNESNLWNFSAKYGRTVEFWIRANSSLADNDVFLAFNDTATGNDVFVVRYEADVAADTNYPNLTLELTQFAGSGASAYYRITNKDIRNNTWHHVAFVWYNVSTTKYLRAFFDGTSILTLQMVRGNQSIGHLIVGKRGSWGIDELRVTNIQRYNNNFTPGTTPDVSDSTTLALYHFNNPALDTQRVNFSSERNNLTTPATFNQRYNFSIKWHDENNYVPGNITMVIFDTNITGTRKNYSLAFNPKDESHFFTNIVNRTTFKDSRFYWKFYANDSNGNINRSQFRNGSVDETPPSAYKNGIRFTSITGGNQQRYYANITDNLSPRCLSFQINDTNTRTGTRENRTTCVVVDKANTSILLTYSFVDPGSNAFQLMKIFYNDTSQNMNSSANKKNFTIVQAGGGGEEQVTGSGGGGGGSSVSLRELNITCPPDFFSFSYYRRPRTLSRDVICENIGKEQVTANLEVTTNLSKYITAEFCDIDGLKCSKQVNLRQGETGLLKIRGNIPEDLDFVQGFIRFNAGKVTEVGVEITPAPGFRVIGWLASFTGASELVIIYILAGTFIAFILLLYYSGAI